MRKQDSTASTTSLVWMKSSLVAYRHINLPLLAVNHERKSIIQVTQYRSKVLVCFSYDVISSYVLVKQAHFSNKKNILSFLHIPMNVFDKARTRTLSSVVAYSKQLIRGYRHHTYETMTENLRREDETRRVHVVKN